MVQTKLLNDGTFTYSLFPCVKEDPNKYNKNNRKESKRTNILKRISLAKLMDLKIDYAFKQLFGNENNKKITIEFLNAILQNSGRSKIKEVTFLNREIGREFEEDKESRLDLLVLTDTNERVNVEIQFTNKYDMIERTIFYWARTYTSTLLKGGEYNELRPVIVINILNYDMINETDLFHTMFHLREDIEHFKLTNIMEFHFIEMPKLISDWQTDKLDPWNDVLARWLLMLGMVDARNKQVYNDIYKELEMIAMKDETLRDAFSQWEDLSSTQEQYLAYHSRLKKVLDEEAYRARIRRMEKELEQKKQEIEQGQRRVEQDRLEIEQGQRRVKQDRLEIERNKKMIEQGKLAIEQEQQKVEQEQQKLKQEQKKLEQDQKKMEQQVHEIEKSAQQLREKAEKTAIHLIQAGLDINEIQELTGLTKDEIMTLQHDLE